MRTPLRRGADLRWIAVDSRNHFEACVVKADVTRQSASEMPHADDDDRPLLIETEELVQLFGERIDLIADATDAEVAELRQVFTDLCRGEMESLRKVLRRDGVEALRLQLAKTAQIEGETVQCGR